MNDSAASTPLELKGIDGVNPLGFLAALGILVALRQTGDAEARLGWKQSVTWVPVLDRVSPADPQALCQSLANVLRGKAVSGDADKRRVAIQQELEVAKKEVKDKREEIKRRRLRGEELKAAKEAELSPLEEAVNQKRQVWLAALKDAVPRPELALGKHIDCTDEEYRTHAEGFFTDATHANREAIDLLAAFGSDACLVKTSDRIEATPFCFITGSGHQYFLDTVSELMDPERVTPKAIHAALFEPWTYSDEKLSMRWDPLEARRYALLDRDPTAHDNKPRTVWMANLLAYRALSFFPSAPKGKRLATTAWGLESDKPTFTWPIWKYPADPDTIRSLLQMPELSQSNPESSVLRARGIVAAFRSRRIKVGEGSQYKINFSPSRSIWTLTMATMDPSGLGQE